MTNTVCPPPGENRGRNTFFMALGQKGDDHDEIDQIFADEMKVLSETGKTFYHGGRKELIRVKAGTVLVCVERPERASLYQIGDHNGTYSTVWGYAMDVDGSCTDNCLPSCPFCRRERLKRWNMDEKTGDDVEPDCPKGECHSWNLMSTGFTCKAPKDYPNKCDSSPGAPTAPPGRECLPVSNGNRRLPCVYLTIAWLEQAVTFAHHNAKTPVTPRRKTKFWNKGQFTAFIRTCGMGGKLHDRIFACAMEGIPPVMPFLWGPRDSLRNVHYAAMHMLFLGHAKSNYDMVKKVQARWYITTAVGTQANKYLRDIQALRCSRFFNAQPLSTSSWGTGVWVSENYLFWVRCVNFFCTLPAISVNSRRDKEEYKRDLRMVFRFCSASLAAISRIMSEKKGVGDMDRFVKIYLDTMVEMDRWMHERPNTVDINTQEVEADIGAAQADSTAPRTKKRKKDSYNYTKSNSLGILAAADTHRLHGPATLHWEGGWAGERKIQPAKAQLGIKRKNADWRRLALQNLWGDNILSDLIDRVSEDQPLRDQEVTE